MCSASYTGVVGIWEEDHRCKVPFSMKHIKGNHQHGLSLVVMLNHLTEVVFVVFLHCKVTLPLPPSPFLYLLYSLEGSFCVQPKCLKSGELCFTSFEGAVSM